MKKWELINSKNKLMGRYPTWADALSSLMKHEDPKDFRVIRKGYKFYEVNLYFTKYIIRFNYSLGCAPCSIPEN